ncbi:hypothetical protein U7537_13610 [Lacticaseibacillus rhamnosus]
MKIAFVLPPFSEDPIGGYEMVYKYANELSTRGHQIDIYYLAERFMVKPRFFADSKMIAKKIIECLNPSKLENRWFSLNTSITEHFHQISAIKQPHDAIIATAIQTAKFVSEQSSSQGEKYYFIQGLEEWIDGGEEQVIESYFLPLHKVVISKWLEKFFFEKTGEHSFVIPNSIDTTEFFPSQPIKKVAQSSCTVES